MRKKLFVMLLTISMLLVSVGVYASENSESNLLNILVSCPACDASINMEMTVSQGYKTTPTTHTLYDHYEGTCEWCGHFDYIDFTDNPESHSFEHIHREINGSYVDLDKCTVCGYEVYNND